VFGRKAGPPPCRNQDSDRERSLHCQIQIQKSYRDRERSLHCQIPLFPSHMNKCFPQDPSPPPCSQTPLAPPLTSFSHYSDSTTSSKLWATLSPHKRVRVRKARCKLFDDCVSVVAVAVLMIVSVALAAFVSSPASRPLQGFCRVLCHLIVFLCACPAENVGNITRAHVSDATNIPKRHKSPLKACAASNRTLQNTKQ
jgi:hypothetical protein